MAGVQPHAVQRSGFSHTVLIPKPFPRPRERTDKPSGHVCDAKAVASEEPTDEEPFRLIVETVNVTSRQPLKKHLLKTTSNVVLAQEIATLDDQLADLQAWGRAHGWKIVAAPSKAGVGGKPSAGVAICVRDYLGIRCGPVGPVVAEHRLVAAIVEAPGWPGLQVASLYLNTSQALSQANVALLALAGALFEHNLPTLVGGDMQMMPAALTYSGLPARVGCRILAPRPGVATCVTAKASSQIDMFLASVDVALLLDALQVVYNATHIATHRPVVAKFLPNAGALGFLVYPQPQKLPRIAPIGPRRAPMEWSAPRAAAEVALDAALSAPLAEAQSAITAAWRWFVNTVELSVAQATDTVLRNPGRRGQIPQPVWRNVLPKTTSGEDKACFVTNHLGGSQASETGVRKRLRGKQPPSTSTTQDLSAQMGPRRHARSHSFATAQPVSGKPHGHGGEDAVDVSPAKRNPT